MARVPEKSREHFLRLSREIQKYGRRGKSELDSLFANKPPKAIFSLPPGPVREAHLAELIGEMQEISRDFAEDKARASRRKPKKMSESKKRTKAKKPKVDKPKVVSRSSGNVDGFSYNVLELDTGDIFAKINRKGRNIFEHENAPSIYDSVRLKKSFNTKDEADFEVRRVVNTAMIWYDTRGLRPREKVRRSREAGRGILRRTSGDRSAIAAEEVATRAIKRKQKDARERKDRLLGEKVRRKSNPGGKSLRHIPRVNPSNPSHFAHSEDTAEKQAAKSFQSYLKYKNKWEDSLRSGKPRFAWVMKSYDSAENSRANYLLSGNAKMAEKLDGIKAGVRTQIKEMFEVCFRKLSKASPKSNPKAEVHGDIGRSLLVASSRAMGRYEESGNLKDLLDANDGYVAAIRELKRGWTSSLEGRPTVDEIGQAKAGAKKTRLEILKKMKG